MPLERAAPTWPPPQRSCTKPTGIALERAGSTSTDGCRSDTMTYNKAKVQRYLVRKGSCLQPLKATRNYSDAIVQVKLMRAASLSRRRVPDREDSPAASPQASSYYRLAGPIDLDGDMANTSDVSALDEVCTASQALSTDGTIVDASSSLDGVGLDRHEICSVVLSLTMGNAMLIMPYAFVLTGWASMPLMVASLGLLLYTALQVGDTLTWLQKERGIPQPSYGDIGDLIAGRWCCNMFRTFEIGECAFLAIFMHVFVGNAMQEVVDVPKGAIIAFAALVGWLLSFTPQRYLSLISIVGVGLTTLCAVVAVVNGLEQPHLDDTQTLFGTQGVHGVATTVAFAAFAFADHPYFVGLHNLAVSPEEYAAGMKQGCFAFTSLSMVLCGLCYATFGEQLHPIVVRNITDPFVATCCCSVLAVRSIVVLPSVGAPLEASVLDRIAACVAPGEVTSAEDLVEARRRTARARVAIRIMVFVACALCAVCLSELIIELESLSSAIFKTANAFVVPCTGSLLLRRDDISRVSVAALSLALCLGITWGLIGTISSLATLLRSFNG